MTRSPSASWVQRSSSPVARYVTRATFPSYRPFTYAGEILTPVTGWTTHHCVLEHDGSWWLVCHDSKPSGGVSRLRSMKVLPLTHRPDGTIATLDGGKQ